MNKALCAVTCALATSTVALADTYNDAVGDTFFGGILDIVSVEVTNDASEISFTFNLAGDPIATDWGKYMVIIDSVAGGDTAGNGWARPISMPSGADYWVGSWVDSGTGAETYHWDGASWILDNATWNPPSDVSVTSVTASSVTITTSLASLGLGFGDVILFDAFTSGGGGTDGAIDSLGNPNQQVGDWGDPSEAHPVAYTIIPAPASVALAGLGIAVVGARRRR